jgi:hypothetical protein
VSFWKVVLAVIVGFILAYFLLALVGTWFFRDFTQ